MNSIKIKYKTPISTRFFNIKLDKLIYVLSKLENNNNLKFENQKQIETLMKKYNLFDEYFLENINKL